MSEAIWVSDAVTDTELEMGFGFPEDEFGLEQHVKWYRDLAPYISKGEVPPPDLLPRQLETSNERTGNGQRMPDGLLPYLVRWKYPLISRGVADVFRRFDLAGGILHPVDLYIQTQKRMVDQEFFLLIPGTAKKTVDIEASPKGVRTVFGRLKTAGWIADDAMAVHRACLQGADLWVDSGLKGHAFYVRDALYAALKEADLADRFSFKSCRIVD